CRHALQESGNNEHRRPWRQSAKRGSQGETRKPDEKHAALAKYVAEPTAGYETNRKGERVTGDDKLGLREAGTERASNARNGHVDDRGIHDRHKNACKHHDQRNPTPQVKRFTRIVLPDYSKSSAPESTC